MFRRCLYILLLGALALPSSALADANDSGTPAYMLDEIAKMSKSNEFERGSVLMLKKQKSSNYRGTDVQVRETLRQDHGLVLQDGKGGIIVIPSNPSLKQNENVVDARELKLKIRELASQLVVGLPSSLSGHIALPTSFVLQDDFDRSSSFGRFVAEQLYYEFNQRGLRTVEYRLAPNLTVREDGEFVLTRQVSAAALDAKTLYVVGTYFTDGNILILNARLIRSSGEILRTGQLIMPVSPLTKRMLANSGRRMQEGNMEIRDFKTEARQPEAVTAFDQGLDIH